MAFPIYLSIIWKILYTQQENVAKLGFLKHANTLLRKMWHLIFPRGKDDLQTTFGEGVFFELHLVADYSEASAGNVAAEEGNFSA